MKKLIVVALFFLIGCAGKYNESQLVGQWTGIPAQRLVEDEAAVRKLTSKSLAASWGDFNGDGRDEVAVELDEEGLASYLYTAGLPDPDLLIRTGGELRISNFLIWQSVYSEFYFSDMLWPDFDEKELDTALAAYHQRQRRFGRL